MRPARAKSSGVLWLRRLSEVPISARLCLAPGLVLCVFLALAGLSYQNLRDSQHRIRDLSAGAFQTFRLVSKVDDLTDTFHTELLRTLSIAATESDQARVTPKVVAARLDKEQMVAAFDELRQHADARLPAFAKLDADLGVYSAAADIVLGVVESDPASASIFMAAAEHCFDRLSARLDELRDEADKLNIRATTASRSVETLRQQQQAAGYNLRGDIASAADRMQMYIAKGDAALKAKDMANAQKYYDLADAEISKVEKFLGH